MPDIKVEHISRSYASVQALKNISLEIRHAELFGLIGPDGAGKTSLIRILSSLLLPDSGDAWLGDDHVVKDFKSIRNKIGYMPGKFALYQDLSVSENLDFFARVFGSTIEENYHLIKDIYIQLEPFKTRRAGNLSGGMKQKLALCCALIHKPDFLILDEPTTGVDAVSRREFWDMLQNLKEQGITILVSTPYMDEALRCDRVALIQKGEILAVDKPSEMSGLFPRRLYAVRASDMYLLQTELKQMDGILDVNLFGRYLHITSSMEQGHLKELLNAKAWDDFEFKPIEPGIEDVFIYLMTAQERRADEE